MSGNQKISWNHNRAVGLDLDLVSNRGHHHRQLAPNNCIYIKRHHSSLQPTYVAYFHLKPVKDSYLNSSSCPCKSTGRIIWELGGLGAGTVGGSVYTTLSSRSTQAELFGGWGFGGWDSGGSIYTTLSSRSEIFDLDESVV